MANNLTLKAGDRDFKVQITPTGVVVDGVATDVPARAFAVADGDRRLVFLDGDVFELEVIRPGRRQGSAHHSSLTAPMPATVIRINVAPGASVRKGDTLVVLEAMKMELPVRASADGTVTTVACEVGQLVQPGVALVEMED